MSMPYISTYFNCNPEYTQFEMLHGMGCNDMDNDCDFIVEECDEDLIPPKISTTDALYHYTKVGTAVTSRHNVISLDMSNLSTLPTYVMKGICFNSTDTARNFILANLNASDDCSTTVTLAVDLVPELSDSGTAAFKATANDMCGSGVGGNMVHLEMFVVEMLDGFDMQGLLSDDSCG
eukprot:6451134-Ditylum_brightwellii.AAC.1